MENEIIDDFQSGITQNQTDSKQRSLIKTFGWISFGIAIFYLLSGLVGLVSTSVMNTFSQLSSTATGNQLNFFERISSFQMLSTILTLIVSIMIIVGAIGFATFKEWGRKLYLAACIGALLSTFFGVFITIYTMSIFSEFSQSVSGMSRQDAQVMEGVFGTFGSVFSILAILFSLIPITYLIINIFIAINAKTKALMS